MPKKKVTKKTESCTDVDSLRSQLNTALVRCNTLNARCNELERQMSELANTQALHFEQTVLELEKIRAAAEKVVGEKQSCCNGTTESTVQ